MAQNMEITYQRKGDYLFPNLVIENDPVSYGKYGMLRKNFLKENKRNWYQSMMLSGRLENYLQEIDEQAREGILPLLTVQPLLENAVEHGIAPAGGGRIVIQCARGGDCLHLGIINTGRGAAKEDRERIDAALNGQPTGKHLGLANIVNRLKLIYGDAVAIRVDTDQPGQTAVSIVLPREIR